MNSDAQADSDIVHVRRRIHDLEQLIRSLVEDRNGQAAAALDQLPDSRPGPVLSTLPVTHDHQAGTGKEVCESIGRMQIRDAQTIYVSPNHWAAILDNSVHPIYQYWTTLIDTDRRSERFLGEQ